MSGAAHGDAMIALDASQRAVVDLADADSASVLGAPGTGKTTTLVELVADRVAHRGFSPDEIVVLSASRASATVLRDRLAMRVGVASNGPLARTASSLAFEIVANRAKAEGAVVPRLVTGGEQDADIADLLEAGSPTVPWPAELGPEVRRLPSFRAELRDLMARATDHGVSPERLAQLGREHDRPAWVAAGTFVREYLDVVTASRPSQLDSSEFAGFAIRALEDGLAGERVARLRLLVIDDLQEATTSTLGLVRALARTGLTVVAFGDPDVAANAFRGGEPDAPGTLASVIGAPVTQLVLRTAHRQAPALRRFTSSVTERVGTAHAGVQRRAVAGSATDVDAPVLTIEAPSPAREWAAIARHLREAHLIRGVPWSELAVVVRSSGQIAPLRRALALAEVPARSTVGGTALRDDRAARALLRVVELGVHPSRLDAAAAVEVLTGPFGALDGLGLRRLRLALRAEEIAGGGDRHADELLVDALSSPGRLATIDHRVGRQAARLAETLERVRTADGTIEELLWLVWERSGLARDWYEQALSTGITAAEANERLDGVVALFTAARKFVERRPGDDPALFIDDVLFAAVPEDTLSPQPAEASVLVTTPSGVVGLEVDTVVVAGLQDGVWPNLRLRGSLLGARDLVRVVTGDDSDVIDERRLVRDDEVRMFALAISRARTRVVLAAVANDEEAPSVLLSLAPAAHTSPVDVDDVAPFSLRGITGRLRRELLAGAPWEAEAASSSLSLLAVEGVPGADPRDWHGLLPISTDVVLFEGEDVPISPSRLERFEQSPLDWFIETVSGSEATTSMAMGTILHWAMETASSPDLDAVLTAVDARWSELVFEAPWLAESTRRAARTLAAAIAEYLGDFAREGKTLVGAESRFRLELPGEVAAVVNGSIDRVERASDGSVVIVDLKTGSPITKQDDVDAHAQLQAYQLAYAEGVLDEVLAELGSHAPGGAKLLWVKEGKGGKLYRESVQAVLGDEGLEAFRTRVRVAAAGMAAAEFEGALELADWSPGGASRLTIHRVGEVSSD